MREIKFRAWDKKFKIMISHKDSYADYIAFDGTVHEIGEYSNYGGGGKTDEDVSSQYDLMQYTGLKDKNGVEIYESDLIQITISNHWTKSVVAQRTVSVEFKDYKFGVQWGGSDFTGLDGFTNTTFEVVGNIYEPIKEPTT